MPDTGANGAIYTPGDKHVTVRFVVPYETKWGESLVISGSRGLLGAGDVARAVKMTCAQGLCGLLWEATVRMPEKYQCTYKYIVWNDHLDTFVAEEAYEHSLKIPSGMAGRCMLLADSFQTMSDVRTIYQTGAFSRVVFAHKEQVHQRSDDSFEASGDKVTVRFRIQDHTIQDHQTIHVVGSAVELGSWQETAAVAMHEVDTPVWECEVQIARSAFPFKYRYFIMDSPRIPSMNNAAEEEAGDPRVALLYTLPLGMKVDTLFADGHCHDCDVPEPLPSLVVLSGGHFCHKRPWRASGVAIPVFSLRTNSSIGCGEFLDIKLMVDFAAKCGMRVLQVLPVNDTSAHNMWWDSYPYSCISVFALHPIYLSVRALLDEDNAVKEVSDMIEQACGEANRLVDMDYEATRKWKLKIARAVFETDKGLKDLNSSAFNLWFERNADWLKEYAAFCFLQDIFGTADHREWGAMHSGASDHIARLTDPSQPFHHAMLFNYWLQWHLHLQLKEAAEHAKAKRIILKGDLPIGVSKSSADTWAHPELFRMSVGVGSPPDAFDPNGQNWGFPGYNWEEMAKDGYAWWQARLTHLAQYFTANRIDHVLGFFRVYEVPEQHCTGALGHFRPSIPLPRKGLENLGLWDIERLCNPWIPEAEFNRQVCVGDRGEVLGKYLEPAGDKHYKLVEGFESEKTIMDIQAPKDSPSWLSDQCKRIRQALLYFVSNVILLRDPEDGDMFHPRFNLMKTSSFAAFDPSKHGVLTELHDAYFYSKHNHLWADSARCTLPALMSATDMLLCGEDLGFVPSCVPSVMHELGVIGLRIQRMPGVEMPAGAEFGAPASYSYWTVAAPSCHDTTPLRAWYEEDAGRRERFYYHCIQGPGEAPEKCRPDIVKSVLQQHLASPAIFCISPIQDWLALSVRYHARPAHEETINDPTNPRHYWRWRMSPTIEALLEDDALLMLIQNLNLSTGRTTLKEVHEG